MRRSISSIVLLVALTVATSSVSVSAGSSMASSSGSMGDHMAFVIGSWNCTVKLAAMMGNPASTDHGVVTFSKSPGNTIHAHMAAADYSADQYYGYDPKTKTHWTSQTDIQGNLTYETSKDGVTFIGSTMSGGSTTPARDTFTHPSASAIRDLTQIESKGTWSTLADATCTKM
jgi:hypothetical protein